MTGPTPADASVGARNRLDRELVVRGLARSRAQAQALITAGAVQVGGVTVRKPADLVAAGVAIEAGVEAYVSRAAYKLLGALDDLGVAVSGRALDAGSSTGGFTQVLLERGAEQVVAVDVGTDQLHPSLRADPRVRVREQTNLRELALTAVDDCPVDLTVADVSFISLTLLVEPLARVTAPGGSMLLMVKPQFEVGRALLGKGGVVRSPGLRRQAVQSVLDRAALLGWYAVGATPSQRPGAAGNREFFVWLRRERGAYALDLDALVSTPTPARTPPASAYAGAGD